MKPPSSLPRRALRSLAIALLALVIASLARYYLLAPLGTRIVWVTFYPAVMLAALLSLDSGQIEAVVAAVARHHPALGAAMQTAIARLQYAVRLGAVRAARQRTPALEARP